MVERLYRDGPKYVGLAGTDCIITLGPPVLRELVDGKSVAWITPEFVRSATDEVLIELIGKTMLPHIKRLANKEDK